MPESGMYIASALFARHGIRGIFSLRSGGVSAPPFDTLNLGLGLGDDEAHVHENLQRLLAATGLPMPHTARQSHGDALLRCHGPGTGHDVAADILLADAEDTAVAVRVADCVPILLADPRHRRLAAVHAGWRGTALQVAARAVEAMRADGTQADEILAAIGPCIGPCCYAVGTDTAEQLGYPAPADAFHRIDGAIHADLALINARQLRACGIPRISIEQHAICTACHPEALFSYRRDGSRSGRQLAVAAWAPSP
jgi:hypothetical protein